ncbi:cytochrome c peroxidase [uncultured Desulfuromonas sp.]|uniref:cytochrome-c peroxidase n=1 Tax=uncultured Desulfuromonas sp. TaxID=181013 RepID=UPI002AAB0686|nr:cytochrome c peroxidase [uncultured Desulfuromonas sp.]
MPVIKTILCLVVSGVVLSGNAVFAQTESGSSLQDQARFYFDVIPDQVPRQELVDHFEEKVALGQRLFFDPRLSLSQTVSCHSCHNLSLGGDDGRSVSVGHGWQTGPRNAPTVFNSVLQIAQFWDGRARDLIEQAGAPMTSPVEMASTDPMICDVLSSMPDYVQWFSRAFPDRNNPICFATTRHALAAFVATLLTPDAPFDRYLQGQLSALTDVQKTGLRQFIALGCTQCHMSTNLGGNSYYRFGVKHEPEQRYRPENDRGRCQVITTIREDYVFKVPTLRNVALTAPYFHSGSAWTLEETVEVMAWVQLDKKLTRQQVDSLVVFMDSLTGTRPTMTLPSLPASTPKTPHPSY